MTQTVANDRDARSQASLTPEERALLTRLENLVTLHVELTSQVIITHHERGLTLEANVAASVAATLVSALLAGDGSRVHALARAAGELPV